MPKQNLSEDRQQDVKFIVIKANREYIPIMHAEEKIRQILFIAYLYRCNVH